MPQLQPGEIKRASKGFGPVHQLFPATCAFIGTVGVEAPSLLQRAPPVGRTPNLASPGNTSVQLASPGMQSQTQQSVRRTWSLSVRKEAKCQAEPASNVIWLEMEPSARTVEPESSAGCVLFSGRHSSASKYSHCFRGLNFLLHACGETKTAAERRKDGAVETAWEASDPP